MIAPPSRTAVTSSLPAVALVALLAAGLHGSMADARMVMPVPNAGSAASASSDASTTASSSANLALSTPVIIAIDHGRIETTVHATTVQQAIDAAHITLGRNDIVVPARESAIPNDGKISVKRVIAWTQSICSKITPRTLFHSDRGFRIGTTHVVNKGSFGLRRTTIRFTSIDGKTQKPQVLAQTIVAAPRPRVIARGSAHAPLANVAATAFEQTGALTRAAMAMIATAYTAYCDGCSGTGRGATGMRVSHGVVAVDPNVIPLGSHLYIPGYGRAIAGDTGGAIIGRRIDLAFDSYRDAIAFGRRPVQVYVMPKSR